jgi:hypothetical protein
VCTLLFCILFCNAVIEHGDSELRGGLELSKYFFSFHPEQPTVLYFSSDLVFTSVKQMFETKNDVVQYFLLNLYLQNVL